MNTKNIDIHGEKLSPSDIHSRIRGLTGRYNMNKQMIQMWRTLSECSNILYREYDQSRVYPEVTALFIKNRQYAREQMEMLRETQLSIQREIDHLQGRLPLPEPEDSNESI